MIGIMTQEEIKEYADELAQQYFPNEYNVWARENVEAIFVSEACVKMAKYVERELIEKACEWLEKTLYIHTEIEEDKHWCETHKNVWVTSDYETVEDFINSFRKTMEE